MREKINNIYLGGITGFIFSTLLVTVGILKTIIIVLFTCITAWGSYLIGKYNINLSSLSKIFMHKN